MTDYVQLQEDVTHLLLSAPPLERISVVQFRKLRLESELSLDALWQTYRAGRCGAGILVEMPVVNVASPNVSGPAVNLILPLAVIEEPNTNFAPATGTLMSAEEIAQIIFDLLHLQAIEGLGTLRANAIREAAEFPPGLVAYRVELQLTAAGEQTARCAAPVISVAGGVATITTGTGGAEIRYTLDGSFPGASNPAALLYAGPFPVESGQIIRAGVTRENSNSSEIRRHIVS